MTEDDEYPPYREDFWPSTINRQRDEHDAIMAFWREVVIIVGCGIISALAIGVLLVVYGVL